MKIYEYREMIPGAFPVSYHTFFYTEEECDKEYARRKAEHSEYLKNRNSILSPFDFNYTERTYMAIEYEISVKKTTLAVDDFITAIKNGDIKCPEYDDVLEFTSETRRKEY